MEGDSTKVYQENKYKQLDTFIPELPHDKDFHLFVCYVSENVEEVRIIVKHLEDYGIKCCYYDRNFIPGQMIIDNMNRGIRRSLGMVIVLSEEFVSSKYCNFEVHEALHMRITEGYTLIPVKIEPCDIPEYIQHISYIDASQYDIDQIHLKVIESIAAKVTQDEEKKKNGEHRVFTGTLYKNSKLSVGRYRLQISTQERQKLWKDGFEVSNGLLDTAESIVNDSKLAKYLHVYINFFWILTGLAYASFHLLVIVLLAVLLTTSNTTKTELKYTPAFFVLVICPSVLLLVYGVVLCYCYCYFRNLETPYTAAVSRALRQDYFIRKLERRTDLLTSTDDHKELTDKVFEVFLRNEIYTLLQTVYSKDQRHILATEGKCPCLLVQERVFRK